MNNRYDLTSERHQSASRTFSKVMAWTNPLMIPILIGATIGVMAHNFAKAINILDDELDN